MSISHGMPSLRPDAAANSFRLPGFEAMHRVAGLNWRPTQRFYLLKESGRVTATLAATSYPRGGVRWIELDNNFSLQNLLCALFREIGLGPDG